jgi:hypothetical protein
MIITNIPFVSTSIRMRTCINFDGFTFPIIGVMAGTAIVPMTDEAYKIKNKK